MKLRFFLVLLTLCTLNIFTPGKAYAQKVQTFSKPGVMSGQDLEKIATLSCARLNRSAKESHLYLETMWRYIRTERTLPTFTTHEAIEKGITNALTEKRCTLSEARTLEGLLFSLEIIEDSLNISEK